MLLRNKCIVHSVIIAIDRKRAAIAGGESNRYSD